MAFIKEPKRIDFVIKNCQLTKEEEMAISNFIQHYKAKESRVANRKKKTTSTKKDKTNA